MLEAMGSCRRALVTLLRGLLGYFTKGNGSGQASEVAGEGKRRIAVITLQQAAGH